MRTAAYNVDVASDRRRRKNVPRHILCSVMAARRALKGRKNEVEMPRTDGIMKQESAEENSVYMGRTMENKGIMYVLASKPYHEVKEPGYQTIMIGQDLPEEYEEKKDGKDISLESVLTDICEKAGAEYIGICSSDRYFVDAGRLLSVKKMQKLLEQTPVILGDRLTGQSEKLVQKNRKAESIDEPEKEEIPCLMIKKEALEDFCRWYEENYGQNPAWHTNMIAEIKAWLSDKQISYAYFHTEKIDTNRLPAMYELVKDLTEDLVKKYQQGNFLYLPPIDRTVGKNGRMPVWICWWQGISEAPELVQRCIARMEKMFGDKADIRIITFDNYRQYIAFSETVVEKFNNGCISMTHLSDILRAQLLCRYGGLWIDATYYIWDDRFIDALCQFPFFTQKQGGELNELDIVSGRWANNFMKGPAGFPLFGFMVEAFELFWGKYDEVLNYFLFDYIIAVCYEQLPEIRMIMDACPVNNRFSQVLADWGNEACDPHKLELLTADTWLFKLTYKKQFSMQTSDGQRTYYAALMEKE